jgi:hypothetical protein
LLAPSQPPSWRTTPCRLSATAYSIIRSYPPYLEAVCSIRHPRTRHAVITVPLNMDLPTYLSEITYMYSYKHITKSKCNRPIRGNLSGTLNC